MKYFKKKSKIQSFFKKKWYICKKKSTIMKKYLIILLCLGVYSLKAQYTFDYKNFEKITNLTLEGNAKRERNRVRLTSPEISQKGGIWHTKQKINIKNGFITEFTFRIHENGISWESNLAGADGIAFVIHNNLAATDQGQIGGGMGYEGIPNCVAVEFDTWQNELENDNHIAIQSKGKNANSATFDATLARNEKLPVILKNGGIHKTVIEYKDKKMTIFLNDTKIIEQKIDLANIISLENDEKAWIGFTASTGSAFSKHEIHSWKFKEYPPPPPIVIEKPKTLENRNIVGKNKIKVKSRKIELEIWDQGIEDGDIISLNLNQRWILENYTIKKRKKIIEITLDGKENYLILHALNLGSSPPNTVALAIRDGKNIHKTLLNSNLKASDSIEITYDGQ